MDNFNWEPDPMYFAFRAEIPGKVRMHTKRLKWDDWVKIDNTYPDQMNLRKEILSTKLVGTVIIVKYNEYF